MVEIAVSIDEASNFSQLVEEAKRTGFKAVEITLNGNRHPLKHFSQIEYRFHCRQYDLALGNRALLHYYKKTMERLSQFGPTHLTLHYGFESTKLETKGVKLLKSLVDMGNEYGVAIAIENLRDGVTSHPQKLIQLLEETGASLTIDLGHLNSCSLVRSGEMKPEEILRELLPYTKEAHIYEREECGHVPPPNLKRLYPLLKMLLGSSCQFWVIELPLKEATRTHSLIRNAFPAHFTT